MLRWLAPLALLWLAWFFGRSLRPGSMALIERICRRSMRDPSPRVVRYTRGLTAVWCGYFLAAAGGIVAAHPNDPAAFGRLGGLVWAGSFALFVGEWALRKLLFRDEVFPSLAQQLRDTWSVWRVRESGFQR